MIAFKQKYIVKFSKYEFFLCIFSYFIKINLKTEKIYII